MSRPAPALPALLALVLLCAAAREAAARAPEQKPAPGSGEAELEAKRKAAWQKQLRKRVGKPPQKLVNLYNSKNKEWLAIPADQKAAQAAVTQAEADDFFRCHFTGERPRFDLKLVPLLVKTALHFGVDQIYVVSGYRAPKYNLSLRKKGREVARDSQHTHGNAVDFRLPGVDARTLRDFVRKQKLGGVGYYPESQFVHADTGKVRFWVGR